jgi:hypothetical protein
MNPSLHPQPPAARTRRPRRRGRARGGRLRHGTFVLFAWTAARVLRRPMAERTWRGTLLGFIPYDFRLPTLARLKEAFWNPADHHLLTPRPLGVGWAINFYELKRRLGATIRPPAPQPAA